MIPNRLQSRPASLLDWLKVGVDMLVDPEREQRLARNVHALHELLGRKRESFNLETECQSLGIAASDVRPVTEQIFKNILSKAWEDSRVTEKELTLIQWAANKLRIASDRQVQLQTEAGLGTYQRFLAAAMQDGNVDRQERAALDQVAAAMGTTVAQLTQRYFAEQSESFLRAVFLAAIDDGTLLQDEWSRMLETARNLGLSRERLLHDLVPQAQTFIEHALADAKSDGLLSEQESQSLEWLLKQFSLPSEFQNYVRREIEELRVFTNINAGRLPSLMNTGAELRAGEVAHFQSEAVFQRIKTTARGTKTESQHGTVVITDTRVIFSSFEKSHALNLRNIVQVDWYREGINVRSTSKGAGLYDFGANTRLAYAILRCAVGRANQTITQSADGGNPRFIPREIRQRVWQKYGGRCMDCQSEAYLEFDHIIPVAKGGSNSENNVQLLCRGCNLKKSDHI